MLDQIVVIVFTFAVCYFLSRILLRVSLFPPRPIGLRLVHLVSAIVVVLVDFLPKLLAHGNNNSAPLLIAVLQFCCFLIDSQRKRYPGRISA